MTFSRQYDNIIKTVRWIMETKKLSDITAKRIRAMIENENRFKVGDKVCALLGGGGYAEEVVVPEGMVMPMPKEAEVSPRKLRVWVTSSRAMSYWGKPPSPSVRQLIM